ncbi:putative molybdopterin binding domain protein, partial [Vibrio parahaemolyticus V-223/04]
VYQVTLYLLC